MKKSLLLLILALLLPSLAMADYNRALRFTSSGSTNPADRLAIPFEALSESSETYTGSYTFGIWTWFNNVGGRTQGKNYGVLISFGPNSKCNYDGNLVFSSNNYGQNITGTVTEAVGATYALSSSDTPASKPVKNVWYYYTLVIDNENLVAKVYVNGEEVITKPFNEPLVLDPDGGNNIFQCGSYSFNGALDEVQIFNRALTADEVKKAANSPKRVEGLTAYYDFQEVIPGSDGRFANKANSFASDVVAEYQSVRGTYVSGGLTNITTIAENLANLDFITEATARPNNRTFIVPSLEDYENLTSLAFATAEGVLTAGEELLLPDGTEVTVTAAAAAGYVIADITVDGVEVEFTEAEGGKFAVISDLDKDNVNITVTRTPHAVTIVNPEEGELVVKFGDRQLASGDQVPAGSTLTLSCSANLGYMVSQYILDGQPVEGNTVVTPDADCTISAQMTTVEYCAPTDKINRNDRYVSKLEVNGVTIEGLTGSTRNVYVDRTSTVVNCIAGDVLEFTSTGAGEWSHTYIYGDFDQNGWTVDTSVKGVNGDLLWFNLMSPDSSEDPLYDMDGNAVTGNARNKNIGGVKASVKVPLDLLPGDYRMRYKVDWASTDPCGSPYQGIAGNGGTIIDFILHVDTPYLDHERTITLVPGIEGAVDLQFTDPAVEGLSLTTNRKKVYVKATPAFGATFNGWYKADKCLSKDLEAVIDEVSDVTINGNVMWSYMCNITLAEPENGTFTVMNGDTQVATGDEILIHTPLTLSAVPGSGHHLAHFTVNGEPTTETTIDLPGDVVIGAVFEEGVEYCQPTWTKASTDRNVTKLTVSDGETETEITPNGGTTKVYCDNTADVATVEAGSTVTITAAGQGTWIHSYVFADFDNNGFFVDESISAPNGDLVWFNAYGPGGIGFVNSDGEPLETSQCDIDGQVAKFTVPANLAPGQYRIRYKTDWNSTNPCGNLGVTGLPSGENHIAYVRGNIIDFTLNVVEALIDHDRTISVAVAEGQDALGTVAITAPATEEKSVLTNAKYVGIEATPAEHAKFFAWSKDGEEVTTNASYSVTDTEDATYTASFGWMVDYSAGEGGNVVLRRQGETDNLISGNAYALGTKLVVLVNPDEYKVLDQLTINGQPVEVTDNQAEVTVDGYLNIEATFTDQPYNLTIDVEGNGAVQVWTEFNEDDDAPAGTQLLSGSDLVVGDPFVVYLFPGTDGAENVEEIIVLSIENGEEPEITLDEIDSFGWPCTYDENAWILPLEVAGYVNIRVKYADTLAAIGDIFADGEEGEIEYYNLNGVRVAAENLQPGIYVARRGNKTAKVYIRTK